MAIKIVHPSNTIVPEDGLLIIRGSAGISIPAGVSSERPFQPEEGTIRFNLASSNIEFYANSDWSTGVKYLPNSRALDKYVLEFNNTTDWTDETTFYSISVSAEVHVRATNPIIQLYELDGSVYRSVIPDTLYITNTGNVVFTVPANPDLRFAGKVIIL